MTNQQKIESRQFVDALASLFSMHYGDCFVGSLNHARHYLQLKTNRYIPDAYVKRAFENIISYDFAVRSGKKAIIGPGIDKTKFRERKHFVYKKKHHGAEETERILEALAMAFKDVDSATCEFAMKEEVAKLQELLAAKKGEDPDARGPLWRETELNALCETPRNEILEAIEWWEKFDPKEAKKKKEEEKKASAMYRQQQENKAAAIDAEFRALFDNLSKRMTEMINQKHASAILILVPAGVTGFYNSYCYDMKTERSIAVLDNTEASINNSGELVFKGKGVDINFRPARVTIYLKDFSIIASESALELRFKAKEGYAPPMQELTSLWKFYRKHLQTDSYSSIRGGYDNIRVVDYNMRLAQ